MERQDVTTLIDILNFSCEKFPTIPAYQYIENGSVVSKSRHEFRHDAIAVSMISSLKNGNQKHVGIIGNTSYYWILAYYGIINSGNVAVPLDANVPAGILLERIAFADIEYIFLSKTYLNLKNVIKAQFPNIIIYDLEQRIEIAIKETDDDISFYSNDDPDRLATLLFTSGTSEEGMKAVMLTLKNVVSASTCEKQIAPLGEKIMSILPIHHCYELYATHLSFPQVGVTVCQNDSLENMVKNLSIYKPYGILIVPIMAKKIAMLIKQNIEQFGKERVKQMLGGNLQMIIIGGASIKPEILRIIASADIKPCFGYGMTESAGAIYLNRYADEPIDSVGTPLIQGMQAKIVDDEILIHGPNVTCGYYKNEKATKALFAEDGWMHTGDLGEINENGFLIVHGRKNNMIVTSNGENVYPEDIEERISMIPNVEGVLVCAIKDQLTAMIKCMNDSPEARQVIQKMISELNKTQPQYKRVSDVIFRDTPFPMTTSMKILRKTVLAELNGLPKIREIVKPRKTMDKKLYDMVSKVIGEHEPFGITDNLFQIGLDSLGATQLALDLDIDPNEIYTYNTIEKLSEHILNDDTKEVAKLKRADINSLIEFAPSPKYAKLDNNVLLTGANGYLGAHFLEYFVHNGYHVTCLIRSKKRMETALKHYFKDAYKNGEFDEVKYVIGDITKNNFNISQEEYDNLAEHIGSVFHCAAIVKHLGKEKDSYIANVGGTKEVIKFCKASGATLYHMSSYAVSGFSPKEPLTEMLLDVGQRIDGNPYIKSKYQAEEEVLLARKEGVASTILRFGNIMHREDGVFQMNDEENGLLSQIRAFNKLGCYPESLSKMSFDYSPVDDCIKSTMLLCENIETNRIWHIMNPKRINIKDLGLKQVSDETFKKKMKKNIEDHDISVLSMYLQMSKDGFSYGINSDISNAELHDLGFTWNSNCVPENIKKMVA